jgi:hypothetical protein
LGKDELKGSRVQGGVGRVYVEWIRLGWKGEG